MTIEGLKQHLNKMEHEREIAAVNLERLNGAVGCLRMLIQEEEQSERKRTAEAQEDARPIRPQEAVAAATAG